MGILDVFRTGRSPAQLVHTADQVTAALATVVDPSTFPIASPWSSSNMQRLVFEDIFGSDIPMNTRSAAMRLPALARARNLLVTTISRLPLRALVVDEPRDPQPSWITRTGDGSSPQHRMAWTVDDLLFYGWSCWWRDNGADGFPLAARRINHGDWSINADNRVEVDGRVVDDRDVVVFSGFHEGILTYGVDAIRDAHTLYRNVRQRLTNPVPQLELHQTGGRPLEQEEIDSLIDGWAAARDGKNGGVGYTSANIETREHGAGGEQLMIEARNAAAVDLARTVGVSASRVDATAPKASLNYETTAGRNQELVDFDLALFTEPIAARLSLDDVVPAGSRVAFDVDDFTTETPSITGPRLED